jgi:hypothetical protein
MCLQFGFVFFWRKDFGTKADHKMLVKLIPGDRNWQLINPNLQKLLALPFSISAEFGPMLEQVNAKKVLQNWPLVSNVLCLA